MDKNDYSFENLIDKTKTPTFTIKPGTEYHSRHYW
jgi:hypothetical protein